eukprot:GHVS01076898.1.p1 GENE.GHVS01076898.1~~GHVS01076898.1.p1  ORF type:complete len:828 (-),score=211.69 GHVS01076898.1:537-3020(-)
MVSCSSATNMEFGPQQMKMIVCFFDPCHRVQRSRYLSHLTTKCSAYSKLTKDVDYWQCPYDFSHFFKKKRDMTAHLLTCAGRREPALELNCSRTEQLGNNTLAVHRGGGNTTTAIAQTGRRGSAVQTKQQTVVTPKVGEGGAWLSGGSSGCARSSKGKGFYHSDSIRPMADGSKPMDVSVEEALMLRQRDGPDEFTGRAEESQLWRICQAKQQQQQQETAGKQRVERVGVIGAAPQVATERTRRRRDFAEEEEEEDEEERNARRERAAARNAQPLPSWYDVGGSGRNAGGGGVIRELRRGGAGRQQHGRLSRGQRLDEEENKKHTNNQVKGDKVDDNQKEGTSKRLQQNDKVVHKAHDYYYMDEKGNSANMPAPSTVHSDECGGGGGGVMLLPPKTAVESNRCSTSSNPSSPTTDTRLAHKQCLFACSSLEEAASDEPDGEQENSFLVDANKLHIRSVLGNYDTSPPYTNKPFESTTTTPPEQSSPSFHPSAPLPHNLYQLRPPQDMFTLSSSFGDVDIRSNTMNNSLVLNNHLQPIHGIYEEQISTTDPPIMALPPPPIYPISINTYSPTSSWQVPPPPPPPPPGVPFAPPGIGTHSRPSPGGVFLPSYYYHEHSSRMASRPPTTTMSIYQPPPPRSPPPIMSSFSHQYNCMLQHTLPYHAAGQLPTPQPPPPPQPRPPPPPPPPLLPQDQMQAAAPPFHHFYLSHNQGGGAVVPPPQLCIAQTQHSTATRQTQLESTREPDSEVEDECVNPSSSADVGRQRHRWLVAAEANNLEQKQLHNPIIVETLNRDHRNIHHPADSSNFFTMDSLNLPPPPPFAAPMREKT